MPPPPGTTAAAGMTPQLHTARRFGGVNFTSRNPFMRQYWPMMKNKRHIRIPNRKKFERAQKRDGRRQTSSRMMKGGS